MEERCGFVYRAPEPYPAVQAGGQNRRIGAAMLENFGGSSSEMSAISRYLYGQIVTAGMPEVAESLRELGKVEMRHLHIFGTLAFQLGMDPRLWCPCRGQARWWSPSCLPYHRELGPILRAALREEQAAVRQYECQLRWIRDGSTAENLRRIILDEQLHIELLGTLLESYGGARLPPP